jgi:hypothetical protein
MIFYYFGGVFNDKTVLEHASSLEKHHFSGVMYTYDPTQGDMFVRVAREINNEEKIKYLVAIRPYTISPQYLYAITKSINQMSANRLQINIVSGYIKDHEKNIGGIVGEVNDLSSSVDRSNYTISFIKELNEMSKKINNSKDANGDQLENTLDFYVSTTNSYVFDIIKEYNNKIIFPYNIYKRGFFSDQYKDPSSMIDFDIKNIDVMLTMTPIIRETEEELLSLKDYAVRPIWKKGEASQIVDDVEYFTPESFDEFITMLEDNGINHLLINAVPREEFEVIIPFIKQYVESKGLK